uniref:Uncharacterized protein n=1 Tax=Setaria italica TaxID=4555 RepID=K3XP66_SETIT
MASLLLFLLVIVSGNDDERLTGEQEVEATPAVRTTKNGGWSPAWSGLASIASPRGCR